MSTSKRKNNLKVVEIVRVDGGVRIKFFGGDVLPEHFRKRIKWELKTNTGPQVWNHTGYATVKCDVLGRQMNEKETVALNSGWIDFNLYWRVSEERSEFYTLYGDRVVGMDYNGHTGTEFVDELLDWCAQNWYKPNPMGEEAQKEGTSNNNEEGSCEQAESDGSGTEQ